jgi:hypothetical protein
MSTRAWMTAAGLLLFVPPTQALAQSAVGIGPRVTFVRGAEGSPDGSQRFSGGALRMGSGRTAIELALDYRSATTGDLTERITDYPIQASLLLYPVRAKLAPYVVGGVGWYSQNVKRFSTAGTTLLEEETTRKMGYHAGFGGELRLHRHVGFHGDYRYTFIRFGDDNETAGGSSGSSIPGWIPFAQRLKLSHEGSMFTWGATFYF